MAKLAAPAFTNKALLEQEDILHEWIDRFVLKIGQFAKTGEVIDLFEWFSFFELDLVGDLAFGEGFEAMEKGM